MGGTFGRWGSLRGKQLGERLNEFFGRLLGLRLGRWFGLRFAVWRWFRGDDGARRGRRLGSGDIRLVYGFGCRHWHLALAAVAATPAADAAMVGTGVFGAIYTNVR